MILTLEVISDQAEDLGAASRKVFTGIGGTIGRLPDNDWVFPDPYVSGRHALIRYLNGNFFVEDTSTNGVFVNSPENRLDRAATHQLKNGDLLYIDAYLIKVSLERPTAEEKKQDDPLELLKAHGRSRAQKEQKAQKAQKAIAPAATPPPSRARDDDRTTAMSRTNDEPMEWLDLGAAPERAEAPAAIPVPSPAPSAAPKSVEKRPPPLAPEPVRPSPTAASPPAKAPVAKAKTTAASGDLFATMLGAAGIDGVEPTAELAETFGAVLRVTVGGLMDMLRSRERMKDDLRMRGTTFKPQHNNPLKFSANVDDAFHNMLIKRNTAYLSPPEAFDDAMHDVRDHQSAIVAAMRIAFESMLAQFDPERLQEEFDKQMKKGSIIGVPAKLRYWELYREKYGDIAQDADSSFRTLFGEDFAKAYEEQLARLQAIGRAKQK